MKRIITCSDGTWNKLGEKDRGFVVETNVQRIYKAIAKENKDGERQLKFYDQGVGTGASPEDEVMGGATGEGIDKNILDAYKFIMWNFEPGDEIYLFGFSRGAYTARSLSGFIRYCGILKSENILMVQDAYQLYRDQTKLTDPDSDLMVSFRRLYSNTTRIKFIGVWDTVGSLGIPLKAFKELNTEQYEFHDVTLSSKVDYAYHALAIHERRKLFEPTLWEKSDTVLNDPNHPQQMEQVWFTGVHSNAGGGYANTGLSDITLEWMMSKAEPTNLAFDRSTIKNFKLDTLGEERNSLKWYYWILGGWKWRDVCKSSYGDGKPSDGEAGNESVHSSVWERYKKTGKKLPSNLAGLKQT